jgi:hypothetical protein
MTNGGYAERPRHTDMIRQHSVVFQFLKVNKTTTERKCYGASKYLKNLNQDQSYQPVKIALCCQIASSVSRPCDGQQQTQIS